MIEDKYKPQAQRAADLFYTLMGAVETCGADPELTDIVSRLADDHNRIRRLFGLDLMQIVRVIYAEDIYPLMDDRAQWRRMAEAAIEAVANGSDAGVPSDFGQSCYYATRDNMDRLTEQVGAAIEAAGGHRG